MNKPDFKELLGAAKDLSSDAVGKIAGAAEVAAGKTQDAVSAAASKVKNEIEERQNARIQLRENEVAAATEAIQGTGAERVFCALGESPLILSESKIKQIKAVFPVPREQCVLWADAEFDLRPSGIACTEKGVFIRSNVDVLQLKNPLKKDAPQDKVKSELIYYHWEDFEPAWFIGDDPSENKVLTVEPQCQNRFLSACKSLASAEEKHAAADLWQIPDISDDRSESVTKVAAVAGAAVESAEAAVFAEQRATKAGHGEMAEEAITKLDRLAGLNAKVVGRDNAKDGADRLVNGVYIQTKYYNSARGSLEACFNPQTGIYRYLNSDGTPMQLEVPKDQYQQVLEGFQKKIAAGKVPGVTDPAEAVNIVREGRLTYKQAVNLTEPGTIESLAYDAATGAVICTCAFGLTFVVTVFLTWRETGDLRQSVQAGVSAGIQVFGITFLQHIVVSQVARTGLAKALLAPSQYIVGKLEYQTSATIVNGLRALSGKGAIYGAAASKQLAKILRSNVLTSVITLAVFSVPDTYKLFVRKSSVAQYTKNITTRAGSVAGGLGGTFASGIAVAKTAGIAGTAVAPGVGTAVGIAGGMVGGVVGAKAADAVGDILHEDDSETFNRLFQAIESCMVSDYMLDGSEMEKLMERLNKIPSKEWKKLLESTRTSEQQEETIQQFLKPHFDAVVQEREPFALPSDEDMIAAVTALAADAS